MSVSTDSDGVFYLGSGSYQVLYDVEGVPYVAAASSSGASQPTASPTLATLAAGGRTAQAPTGKAVRLQCLWLSSAADPSDVTAFPGLSALTVTPTVLGEVRSFAGGVDIAFSRPGKRTPVKVELPHCTRAQLAWLEAHLGRTVCARDDRGRKVFGVYWTVPITENRHNTEASTSLDIVQVAFVEAV